jgi:hypothetical protein
MEARAPASSSRRSVVKGLLAAACAFACGSAIEGCRRTPGRSPWLRVHRSKADPDGADRDDAPALWLALATLPAARREAFLDEIEAALASMEARQNPLLVDLVDDDLAGVVRRNRAWLLPLCTAASALLARGYDAPDGFGVRVVPRGEPHGSGDIVAWTVFENDPVARRARFLAWPASRSRIVRTKSPDTRRDVEAALREACGDSSATLALVVNRAMLFGRSGDERLERVLARVSEGAIRAKEDDFEISPRPPAVGKPLSPWVELSEEELLVVPKLGALSPAERFEADLRRRVAGRPCELLSG